MSYQCIICFECLEDSIHLICTCPACKQCLGHMSCMQPWIEQKQTCPLCLQRIEAPPPNQPVLQVVHISDPRSEFISPEHVQQQQRQIGILTESRRKWFVSSCMLCFATVLQFGFWSIDKATCHSQLTLMRLSNRTM